MRLAFAAAFALIIPPSLSAQTSQAAPDLATAKPIDGSWSYAATSDGSEATFANAGGAPQLWISCTRSTRQVSIAKAATAAAPFIAVWTSSQSRSVPASFNPATGRLTIQLGANDSFLDALSNSRARLGFTVGSEPPLVVPAWAEPARVVEDCRA
jgi:hypothetical protein